MTISIKKNNKYQNTYGKLFKAMGITGTILGAPLGDNDKISQLFEDLVKETIQRIICEKLLLISPSAIKRLDFFPTYFLENGQKKVKSIRIKRRVWKSFVELTNEDIRFSGVKGEDFIKFLKDRRCRRVKIDNDKFENII